MDSSTLTHVAAIIVGVVVTLLVVNGFSSSGNKTKEISASSSNAAGGGGAAATSGAAKKKKKKKNKSKAGAAATGNDNNNNNAAKQTNKAVKIATQNDKDGDDDSSDEDKETAKPVPAEDANKNGTAAGGKKKKKKGGNNSNSSNGTAKKENGNAGKENGSNKAGNTKTTTTTSAAAAPMETAVWEKPPRQQEEEWSSVPTTSKKKKRTKGQSAAAKEATAAATAAAPAADTPATDSVMVDAKKIGIIIGPKGATMQAIQEATGCKLDVNAPPKDEAASKRNINPKATVVLTGDKDGIFKAKKAIQELATKGYATLLQSDNFGEYAVQVHPRYLSEIVGPNGRTIQAIQKTLDVKITIPPTDWKPNVVQVGKKINMCHVGIAGSKENSQQAKAVIKDLIKYHHHEITHPGVIHEEVYVPSEFFHCVIGPRGSEIKHIRGNYKVDIYMPNEDSITDNVIVVGKQSNVDKAINHIHVLMDRDSEQRESKYNDEFY